MRSTRNNSRSYGPSHHDEDRNYGNGQAGYSDRYIYQRDFEDYDDGYRRHDYEDRSYGRNTDNYDRGYEGNGRGYENNDRNYNYDRSGGNYNRGRYAYSDHDQWNEGYDRNYGVGNTSDRYNREDDGDYNNNGHHNRNIFQRAGERIRETWNNLRHRGEERDEHRHGYNSHGQRHWPQDDHTYAYERGPQRENNYRGNYRNESYRQDGDRGQNNSGRIHWGNNSNYSTTNRNQNSYSDRDRNQNSGRRSKPHHDYNYGHSGSMRWNSNEDNDRYYNGQTSGRTSTMRRSRELQEDYPY